MFLTAVRYEVNNLESSVVVQDLELAINLAIYNFKRDILLSLNDVIHVRTLHQINDDGA